LHLFILYLVLHPFIKYLDRIVAINVHIKADLRINPCSRLWSLNTLPIFKCFRLWSLDG